jgi:ankyrin repeat protein
MTSLLHAETESPYCGFVDDPNAGYEKEGLGRRCAIPMTMVDRDGSILYETPTFDLLYVIISENDTKALQQYLTIAPWAVSIEPFPSDELWAIPRPHPLSDYGGSDGGLHENYFLYAARWGGLGVLQMLLDHCTKGRDVTQQIRFKSERFELLTEAAQWGQLEMVQFLLDNQPRYASIHERDPNGYTALASAASYYEYGRQSSKEGEGVTPAKSEAIMNLLLDRGACASDIALPMYGDKKLRNTVLTLAVEWAGSQLIKRLIDGGADVYAKVTRGPWDESFWDQYGSTFEVNALYVACTHANFEALKTLIDCRGAGVDITDVIWERDSRGSLPLHWATQNDLPREIYGYPVAIIQEKARNIANIVELLLDLDPTTINVPDNDGNTPLHYATRSLSRHDKLYTPIFQLLCARGADASIRNNEGQTPLHTLFRLNDNGRSFTHKTPVDRATISTLLAHGATATDADNVGDTPLHIAAANLRWTDAVSYLLQHGADPARQNLREETALHRAAGGSYMGRYFMIKAPERIKAQDDMLARLVKAGGMELMDLADAKGMNPRKICHKTRQEWKELDGPPKQNGYGRGRGRGRGAARRMHKI